ncbi:DUF4136 domain-containing protein [Litoribrevibacter albus]|uniref:DUF4136 domain-containing protein n=1 Tax=Litoribrevibacter albus TaxID=1473156 RepID=A0AA37SED9_9GAMM|nr:DUF4136 domain-containing protein [Litoribrevibacter albus]GLQ32807.1 hypothetical protein GCM10007876_32860 [Litoribrevibacter albus]
MKIIRLSLLILLSWSLIACSPFTISTDYNPALDTQHWQGFQWQLDEISSKDPYDNDLIRKRIVQAMNQQLTAKGFQLSDTPHTDFTVSYFFLVEPRLDVHRFYNHRCPWVGCQDYRFETFVSEYQFGSIIIDIKNGKSGELEWRGIVGSRITEGATPEEREETIEQAINELMLAFPPTPKIVH